MGGQEGPFPSPCLNGAFTHCFYANGEYTQQFLVFIKCWIINMLLYCRAGAPQNLYYIISAEKFLWRMCSANLKHDFINITIFPNTTEWNNKTSPTVWIYRVLWESWCWYICTDFLCLLVVHWDLHQQAGFSLLLVHHHCGWETVCLILFLQASWGSPERQHQSQHRAGSWWPAIWNYSPGCHRITECSTRTKWQCHGTEGSLQFWMEKVTVCLYPGFS